MGRRNNLLVITVVRATDLTMKRRKSLTNLRSEDDVLNGLEVSCTVKVGKAVRVSQVDMGTLTPTWNELFAFDHVTQPERVVFEVRTQSLLGRGHLFGRVAVPISTLPTDGVAHEHALELTDRSGLASGRLFVRISFQEDPPSESRPASPTHAHIREQSSDTEEYTFEEDDDDDTMSINTSMSEAPDDRGGTRTHPPPTIPRVASDPAMQARSSVDVDRTQSDASAVAAPAAGPASSDAAVDVAPETFVRGSRGSSDDTHEVPESTPPSAAATTTPPAPCAPPLPPVQAEKVSPQLESVFRSLFKLPPSEKLLGVFHTSLALPGQLPYAGDLFVSPNYVCFRSGVFRIQRTMEIKNFSKIQQRLTHIVCETEEGDVTFVLIGNRSRVWKLLSALWQRTLPWYQGDGVTVGPDPAVVEVLKEDDQLPPDGPDADAAENEEFHESLALLNLEPGKFLSGEDLAEVGRQPFEMTVQRFCDSFIKDRAFAVSYHAARNDKDVVVTEWKEQPQLDDKLYRVISFTTSGKGMAWMPKGAVVAHAHVTQRLCWRADGGCSMETITMTSGVPYGGYFRIEGRYDVVPGTAAGTCELRGYAGAVFSRTTIFRQQITSTVVAESKEAFSKYRDLSLQYALKEPIAAIAKPAVESATVGARSRRQLQHQAASSSTRSVVGGAELPRLPREDSGWLENTYGWCRQNPTLTAAFLGSMLVPLVAIVIQLPVARLFTRQNLVLLLLVALVAGLVFFSELRARQGIARLETEVTALRVAKQQQQQQDLSDQQLSAQ